MTYCIYWKHADEVAKHESVIDFIFDYQDVIDNKGLRVWWEDETHPDPLIYIQL